MGPGLEVGFESGRLAIGRSRRTRDMLRFLVSQGRAALDAGDVELAATAVQLLVRWVDQARRRGKQPEPELLDRAATLAEGLAARSGDLTWLGAAAALRA